MSILKKNTIYIFLAICAAISFYIFFYHLGRNPLENWDEAWYGEATREMIRSRNAVALFWDRMLWLDKPPLQIWINSILSLPFGISELSVRLVSAVSAFTISLGVAFYSYKKFGLFPAILGFGTLVLNNVFVWRARSGNLDLLVSALIFATYFIILSKNKYKYPILGIVFALIFLTKASIVILPIMIFILHEVFFEYKNIKTNVKEYFKLIILFVTPIFVWLFLGFHQQGIEFVKYYLVNSDQGVAAIKNFNSNYISYAYYALQRRFFYLFIIGLGFLLIKIKKEENFLLFLYSVILLLQLSLTQRSNNWYLVPIMAFWSLTIAYGLRSLFDIFRNNRIVIIGVLVITFYIFFKTYTVNITPIFASSSTYDQAKSSKEVGKLSKYDDVIIRLDPLCPATIYYSDRKVYCLSNDVDKTINYWMPKKVIIDKMKKGELHWVLGTNPDLLNFINDSGLEIKTVYKNDTESVGEVTLR